MTLTYAKYRLLYLAYVSVRTCRGRKSKKGMLHMGFDKKQTDAFAIQIRKNTMRAIAAKGNGHVGGALSIADLLAVLYHDVMHVDPKNPAMPDRDVIVISKGHAGPAMYATLALKGYFDLDVLDTLNQNGTILPSHTDRLKTPGVDMTTGSLGQGASLAAGAALADKLDGRQNYTYLILGDGELDEGQVWESVLFAAQRKLNHLITFVDANGKQLDGTTDEVCALGDIAAKFASFGYHTIDVADGNDTQRIYDAILAAKQEQTRPVAVILHTVKGAGVQLYASMKNCHSPKVSAADYAAALADLEEQERRLGL